MTYSRFDTNGSYRESLLQTLNLATREICILDNNLADMGIESPPVLQTLQAFLDRNDGAVIRIALHKTLSILTEMPRTLELMRRYTHRIELREIPEAYRHIADCHLLVDACHGVRRFHSDHARGSLILDDANEIHPWWSRFDELWKQSRPISVSATSGL